MKYRINIWKVILEDSMGYGVRLGFSLSYVVFVMVQGSGL